MRRLVCFELIKKGLKVGGGAARSRELLDEGLEAFIAPCNERRCHDGIYRDCSGICVAALPVRGDGVEMFGQCFAIVLKGLGALNEADN